MPDSRCTNTLKEHVRFHGITVARILACTFVSDLKDGKENTSPHMSDLRNIAHKCTQSRLCDGFHVCLNIAGIDPSLSWEQTVLLEVFIQLFEHKTGSCAINQCTYSCPN